VVLDIFGDAPRGLGIGSEVGGAQQDGSAGTH